jgi:deazaflavin-dependent oxidoreductase (nitroreductase family)
MSFNPMKIVTSVHTFLYRQSGGSVGGTLLGMPLLLLTTTGRKTGRRFTTPLTYLPNGDGYIIIASNGGSDRHPLWLLNLQAKPEVEIQVKRKEMISTARVATADEAKNIWPRVDAAYSQYANYRAKTTREIPLVILSPGGGIPGG